MDDNEDETYSIMFSSLKHPARRKILRMLSDRSLTFSELLDELGISSSHLTYHLENLGELVTKLDNGKYKLSSFGMASVDAMKGVEDVPDYRLNKFLSLPLKWKTLMAGLLITIIILTSFSAVQYFSLYQIVDDYDSLKNDLVKAQNENEQLLSWSTNPDKAITFLRDVVQIDFSRYRASLISNSIEYRTDLGGVVEEILKYSLTGTDVKVDAVLRFRDGHLSRFQLYFLEGPPFFSQVQPFSIKEAALSLIDRYRTYSGESYIDPMISMISSIEQTESVERVSGDIKLKITAKEEFTEVIWMYTDNQIDFSAKSLRLVYQDNILTEMLDGWFLLKIGSREVNIQEQKAIQIAKEAADNFEFMIDGTQISGFTLMDQPLEVQFVPHPRDNSLALVPYWYITLELDKTYKNGFNRIAVGIWADTGEIANIQALAG